MVMPTWFNVRKAAQVTFFFAMKEGGQINVLKLSKLLYIADREHMYRHDSPILGDMLVSMDHGPVNSITLDFINGYATSRDRWDAFVADRAGYKIGVASEFSEDDLDELSAAEFETLRNVWKQFGQKTKYQLRDWTHNNCPEWEDPAGSSAPIPYERVFKFLGKRNAEELARQVDEDRHLRLAMLAD